MKRFHDLFVAGTFDGLHAGHRFLLTRAFELAKNVTIGLTSDAFVQRYKSSFSILHSHTYDQRKAVVLRWLSEQGFKKKAVILSIDDPCEPAASMEGLDGLIVTNENRARGEEINALRGKRGLPPLALIEVPMLAAQDGRPISSTRLRNGEIDGDGRLVMPDNLRPELQKPMGRVLRGNELARTLLARQGESFIVTVGDVATKTFLDAGITPFLAIIDGKVGRKPYPHVVAQLRKTTSCEATAVTSGPGFMSREAIEAIIHHLQKGGVIVVSGEEDLLVLPAVIHAPVGALVYYGQPGKGLVEVRVTQAIKRKALALISKFT